MENFFENIGFEDFGSDEAVELLNQAIDNNDFTKVNIEIGLSLFQIKVSEKTSINYIANDDTILDFDIDYACHNANKVIPLAWIPTIDKTQYFRILSVESQGDMAGMPLNISMPYANIDLNQVQELGLFAMAVNVKLYHSVNELSANSKMAEESLIPSGTFGIDDDFEPSNEMLMNTKIINVEEQLNRFTNKNFYMLKTNCLGIDLDIIAAQNDFNQKPKVGDIVSGLFCLNGKRK